MSEDWPAPALANPAPNLVRCNDVERRAIRRAQWLIGRPLGDAELDFLQTYFGEGLDPERIRIVASPTRRSWSPFGRRISLAKRHFEGGRETNAIDLADPLSASIFSHEALHVWQRQHGRAVTWEAIPLQAGYMLGRSDPYRYAASDDPEAMLAVFERGNVEQQAQMFGDFVWRDRRGEDTRAFAALVERVRASDRGR